MQLCSQCSSDNPDESIFCGHCANRLNNNCPGCGFRNLWEQKFCGNCGKQLRPDTELGPTAPEYARIQMKTALSENEEREPLMFTTPSVPPSPIAVPPDSPTPLAASLAAPLTPVNPLPLRQPEPQPPPPSLSRSPYALVSLELVDWEENASIETELEWLDNFRQQCGSYLQRRILVEGGEIQAQKHSVLFAAFKQESSPAASIARAIDVCLALLSEDLRCPWGAFKLRIGLDLENPAARNPLCSTPERSVGIPGSLTISEIAFREIGGAYETESIGPVRLGNRHMTFYRVLGEEDELQPPTQSKSKEALPPSHTSDAGQPLAQPEEALRPLPHEAPQPPEINEPKPILTLEQAPEPQVEQAAATEWRPEQETYPETSLPDPLPESVLESEWQTPPEVHPIDEPVSQAELRPAISAEESAWLEANRMTIPDTLPEDEGGLQPAMSTEESAWLEANRMTIPDTLPEDEGGLQSAMSAEESAWLEANRITMPESLSEGTISEADALRAATPEVPPAEPAEIAPPEALTPISETPGTPETPLPGEDAPPPPSSALPPGEPPMLTAYEPPVLGGYDTPRVENIRYFEVSEALGSELENFLSRGFGAETGVKGRILALCAPDGLGKSSIIHTVRNRLDPENIRAIWLGAHHYRCFHQTGLPLAYWLELVRNLLSLVMEGQPGQEVREHLHQFLAYVYNGEAPAEMTAFLEDLLSVEPPRPMSVDSRANLGRVETLLLEFFRHLASKRPLVIVLEDLTYADPASLELLTHLLEKNLAGMPVCLIVTQTPDFYVEGALAEAFRKTPYKEWVVAPLNDEELRRLLNEGPLAGGLEQFPPALADAIIRNSRGLPLQLEEIMRLLHLRGVLATDPETGRFVATAHFNSTEQPLPETLPGLISERLSFLDPDSLYVLRLACVLGEKFAVNVLSALTQMEQEPFNLCLETLFNHGFLLPDVAHMGRFRHGMIWETVYGWVEPPLRHQMHQLISETLENDFKQGLTVPPMLIAHHSECGGLPNRALHYWNLTGIHAGDIGSLTGMNIAMFRALSLLQEAGRGAPESLELALRIAENLGIFNLDDDPERAAELLEWVCFYGHVVFAGTPARLVEPLGFLALACENKGEIHKALEALEKALALVDPNANPQEAASLQINRLDYLVVLGRIQHARQVMEQEIEPLISLPGFTGGDPGLEEARLRAGLLKGQILMAQCDPQAGPLLENTLRQTRERGLDNLEIALRLTQAQFFLKSGRYRECNQDADALLNDIEAMPESDWFLAQWGLLAMLYHCEMEDWTSASQLVLTVISKSESVRDYHTWVLAQAYAGHIQGKQGQIRDARKLIEQAVGLSSEHRFASAALLGWRFLAEFELACGNLEIADEIASKALEIARKPEIRNMYEAYQLTLVCVRTLLAREKTRDAGRLLEPLWPEISQTRWEPLVAACAFEIGQLHKQLAQDAPADLSRKYLNRSVEFFRKAGELWRNLGLSGHVKRAEAAIPSI